MCPLPCPARPGPRGRWRNGERQGLSEGSSLGPPHPGHSPCLLLPGLLLVGLLSAGLERETEPCSHETTWHDKSSGQGPYGVGGDAPGRKCS